jgi:hypothetical protein
LSLQYVIPAPATWNTRAPLALAAETDALDLVNMIPDEGFSRLRRGHALHADELGDGPVETLLSASFKNGTERLVSIADDEIHSIAADGTTADITGTATVTNARWQGIMFNNRLIMVNGINPPLNWNGSGNVDAQAYTGIGDPDDLISVHTYKGRLYFIEKETASFWYGGINEFQGELKEFDLSSVFQRGGELVYVGSFTQEMGDVSTDIFLAASNQGEVLAYVGDFPGAGGNFALIGRFFTGRPLGRRSFMHLGQDVLVMTEIGIFPVSRLLSGRFLTEDDALSGNVNKTFNQVARNRKNAFGWQAVFHPTSRLIVFNVPVGTGVFNQYVMHYATKGWALFKGLNGFSWAILDGRIFFGGAGGKVYEADKGKTDNGAPIPFDIRWAFSTYGRPGRTKQFIDATPFIETQGGQGIRMTMSVNFDRKTQLGGEVLLSAKPGMKWGDSWGGAWASGKTTRTDRYTIRGEGHYGSLRMFGNANNIDLDVFGAMVRYQEGGQN